MNDKRRAAGECRTSGISQTWLMECGRMLSHLPAVDGVGLAGGEDEERKLKWSSSAAEKISLSVVPNQETRTALC